MARVYQQQDNLPRMIVELHRTLELDPANARAKKLLAEAEKESGK